MLAQAEAFLKQELRPAPERHQMMFRYVLVAAIVLVTSMTLQIPSVALSIIMMFSATRENARMTLMAGRMIIIGATCAVFFSLLLLSATLDWPAIRITGAMLLVFAGMFFLRASRFGTVGYLVAVLSVVMQSEADTIVSPDTLVRSCLWLWIAIVYPVVTAIVVAWLTPAASAPRQFHAALSHNWQMLEVALRDLARGKIPEQGSLTFIPGTRVSRYQQFALASDPALVCYRAFFEQVRNTQHLVEAAFRSCAEDMQGRFPEETEREALSRAADMCAQLSTAKVAGAWPEGGKVPAGEEAPFLPETIRLILSSLETLLSRPPGPGSDKGVVPEGPHTLFLSDWRTNPVYPRFALKAMLATFLCYLFYNAVDWPGIRTCMTTAIILSLPSLGSSVHKTHLRIVGCMVGALLSGLCIVFVLPHLDTVTGLLMVSLPVVGLAGWLAAGSSRIDYAGHQIVYAWALAMYGNYGMTLDLTTSRDRIVGILIGAGVVLIVFSTLWPERSEYILGNKLKNILNIIRDVASLHRDERALHLSAGQYIRSERQLSAGLVNDIHQFNLEHPDSVPLRPDSLLSYNSHVILKKLILIQTLCRSPQITPALREAVMGFLDAVAEDVAIAATSLTSSLYVALPETRRVRLKQVIAVRPEAAWSAPERRLVILCQQIADLSGGR